MNDKSYIKNKFIFGQILKKKYKIKKDDYDKNIIVIIFENGVNVKCKCLEFLKEKYIGKNEFNQDYSLIIWSDANPYVDKFTQCVSKKIRSLKNNPNIINQTSQLILNKDLLKFISSIIKNQDIINDNDGDYGKIQCQWILTSVHHSIISYYMIYEIINY